MDQGQHYIMQGRISLSFKLHNFLNDEFYDHENESENTISVVFILLILFHFIFVGNFEY